MARRDHVLGTQTRFWSWLHVHPQHLNQMAGQPHHIARRNREGYMATDSPLHPTSRSAQQKANTETTAPAAHFDAERDNWAMPFQPYDYLLYRRKGQATVECYAKVRR